MLLVLWNDDITLENILKDTVIKYITYTGRYEQAI